MKIRKEQFYESPQMEVFETKVQSVLCASGDPLNQYSGNSWDDPV